MGGGGGGVVGVGGGSEFIMYFELPPFRQHFYYMVRVKPLFFIFMSYLKILF